jgi:hypothetical protein
MNRLNMPSLWTKRLEFTKITYKAQFILTPKVCRIFTPLIKMEKEARYAGDPWLN